MAKGNPILGTLQGTIGDVTVYNYNGSQVTRVCRHQIRNPRTNKQAIQRAIATTVSKFVSAFAPVLNNSIQSESTKVKTLAKIRSLNMNMLRQLAAQNEGVYTPKGTMYVAPNNYIISRGTLAGIVPMSSANAINYMRSHCAAAFDYGYIMADDINAKASDVFPSTAVGDQITILCSSTGDFQEGSLSAYCRFAFKDDDTPALINEGGYNRLNPQAIDLTKADGPWAKLRFIDSEVAEDEPATLIDCTEILSGVQHMDLFGVIVSREAGKLRSNATMLSGSSEGYTLTDVYPTYMDGGTPIDIPSEVYLNNDANVI